MFRLSNENSDFLFTRKLKEGKLLMLIDYSYKVWDDTGDSDIIRIDKDHYIGIIIKKLYEGKNKVRVESTKLPYHDNVYMERSALMIRPLPDIVLLSIFVMPLRIIYQFIRNTYKRMFKWVEWNWLRVASIL